MYFAQANGISIHYRIDGPAHAQAIVLSNSIATDLSVWDQVAECLQPGFRVIRYDSRGHGRTDVPAGPYAMSQLGMDVIGMLDHLGLERVHFCGLSLGGMVGMWLGAHRPERIRSLVLCNTAAYVPPPESWDARAAAVRNNGMQAIKPAVLERWVSESFRNGNAAAVSKLLEMVQSSPADGYIGSCAAIRDMDQRGILQNITAPALVVAGAADIATPPDALRLIAGGLANNAAYAQLDCGHMSNIEQPQALSAEILKFLNAGPSR